VGGENMNAVLDQTSSFLMKKVFDLQENKAWVWVLVFIAVLFFAYAWYCTSKGYDFSGYVKKGSNWVKIGCVK